MTKIKLILIFFTLWLFLPATASAIGGFYDPIYVKIEPTQQTKNATTRGRLKSQYGVNAFYSCDSCANTDTSNPYVEARCLNSTEYCLERQKSYDIRNVTGELPDSFIKEALGLLGGKTIEDPDTGCKNHYGANSYYTGSKEANGSYVCDCKGGYKWNDSRTMCILDDKDGDCKKTYGPYSYWTGKNRECDCMNDYQWDENNKQCVKKAQCNPPNSMDGVNCVSPDDLCVKNYGTNSYFIGNYDESNSMVCDCKNEYRWEGKTCVLIPPTPQPAPPKIQSQEEKPAIKNNVIDEQQKVDGRPIAIDNKPVTLQITSGDASSTAHQTKNLNQKNDNKQTETVKPVEPEKRSRIGTFVRNVGNGIKNIFKKLFRH